MLFIYTFCLAILSYLAATLWYGERLVPNFQRLTRRKHPAEQLANWLQGWQLQASIKTENTIPQYKFYTGLLTTLLHYARTLGAPVREVVWEWREGLNKEQQHDRRVSSLFWGGLTQFALFVLLTWGFAFLGSWLVGWSLSIGHVIAVLCLHSIGPVLFHYFVKQGTKKTFRDTAPFFHTLYSLKTLGGLPLPASKVIQAADLQRLETTAGHDIATLKDRIFALVHLYQYKGAPLQKDCELYLQEAWFIQERRLEKLTKQVENVKLLLLFGLYVPAYFIFIHALLGELLAPL